MSVPYSLNRTTCTVLRNTPHQNTQGEYVDAWSKVQTILCYFHMQSMYPTFPQDGSISTSTHILYTNTSQRVLTYPGTSWGATYTPTDIQPGDIIKDASGNAYRVDSVQDAAGIGDHIEAMMTKREPTNEGQ